MADFSILGAAVYRALGLEDPDESFLSDYNEMRRQSILRTLDTSPVAGAIQNFLETCRFGFEGTVKDAFQQISQYKHDYDGWPKSPKGFADALRRCATSLRMVGIQVKIGARGMHGYTVTIKKSQV